MPTLPQLIPDAEVLLALEPEELALYVFEVAKSNLKNGIVNLGNLALATVGAGIGAYHQSPYGARANEVELSVAEAWNWLRVQGLLIPASGIDGTNGFCSISRRGQRIATRADFGRFREAAAFSKNMLHPRIADKVWLNLARGDLPDAVFIAFRAVEEAVREAGRYAPSDIGVPLMRAAFNAKTGPLTDASQEEVEREALAHLFAGAIGSYKNPHSHRTVTITDPKEAQEMVMLASHLLRIVDARSPKPPAPH